MEYYEILCKFICKYNNKHIFIYDICFIYDYIYVPLKLSTKYQIHIRRANFAKLNIILIEVCSNIN